MSASDREATQALISCLYLLAMLALSAAVAGFAGWPWGLLLFGAWLLAEVLDTIRKCNRELKEKETPDV